MLSWRAATRWPCAPRLELKGVRYEEADREAAPYEVKDASPLPEPSAQIMVLLTTKPRVINVGVESFNESIRAFGGASVQFNWRRSPAATSG